MTTPEHIGLPPDSWLYYKAQMYTRAFRAGYGYAMWADRTYSPKPDCTNPYDGRDESARINDPTPDTLGPPLLIRSTSGRVVVALYPGPPETRATTKTELAAAIAELINWHDSDGLN